MGAKSKKEGVPLVQWYRISPIIQDNGANHATVALQKSQGPDNLSEIGSDIDIVVDYSQGTMRTVQKGYSKEM
jgi:hypothetical protein